MTFNLYPEILSTSGYERQPPWNKNSTCITYPSEEWVECEWETRLYEQWGPRGECFYTPGSIPCCWKLIRRYAEEILEITSWNFDPGWQEQRRSPKSKKHKKGFPKNKWNKRRGYPIRPYHEQEDTAAGFFTAPLSGGESFEGVVDLQTLQQEQDEILAHLRECNYRHEMKLQTLRDGQDAEWAEAADAEESDDDQMVVLLGLKQDTEDLEDFLPRLRAESYPEATRKRTSIKPEYAALPLAPDEDRVGTQKAEFAEMAGIIMISNLSNLSFLSGLARRELRNSSFLFSFLDSAEENMLLELKPTSEEDELAFLNVLVGLLAAKRDLKLTFGSKEPLCKKNKGKCIKNLSMSGFTRWARTEMASARLSIADMAKIP